ncbi:MAG: PHP domain-containing protein [Mogibacterium sp.]|nr:PHP domain-containing protein [Mogibacterium sp.]MBR4091885.1 PHP domain-containing protein [Mogibacterium sp.]
MQKFDLHMHTTYCDGKDTAEAMVLSAIENGLEFAGISGHSFTPHDQSYCMSREGTQQYIEEIRGLKKKYAGSINLLLGTELDRYSDTDLSPYDYYIGSVHYLFSEEGRKKREEILARHAGREDRSASDAEMEALIKFADWCPVDDYAEDLCRFAFRKGGSCSGAGSDAEAAGAAALIADPGERRERMLDIAELYFDTVGGVVAATGCDIIGHFDLITKFNEGWGFSPAGNVISRTRCGAAEFVSDLFDTSDERYSAAWKRAIDRIFDDCAERYKKGYRNRLEKLGVLEADDKPVFEINTGAISKGYRTVPYPTADQISYIKSKGGVLILSSDSHAAGTICYGFEEFANLAD